MTGSPDLHRVGELLRLVNLLIAEIEISDPLNPLENSRETYPAICSLSRELKVHPPIIAFKMVNGSVVDACDPLKGRKRRYDFQWGGSPDLEEVGAGIVEPFKAEILEHLNAWVKYLGWWIEDEKTASPPIDQSGDTTKASDDPLKVTAKDVQRLAGGRPNVKTMQNRKALPEPTGKRGRCDEFLYGDVVKNWPWEPLPPEDEARRILETP